MWQFVFGAANLLAIAAWAILIFLPRRPLPMTAVLYLGVGLLCLAYSLGIILLVSGVVDQGLAEGVKAGFSSIEGIRGFFSTDAGVTLGWTHYLAFDLFIGLWIARDADAKSFSRVIQVPVLFLTLIVGPVGLLTWLVLRERSARLHGRAKV